MHTINSLIYKQRQSKGYTQDYMALELKISQKTYSFIESGKTRLKVSDFIRIIEILEINPHIFFQQIFCFDCESNCRLISSFDEKDNTIKQKELRIQKLERTITLLEASLEKLVLDKHEIVLV